jgi:hypothetical protein
MLPAMKPMGQAVGNQDELNGRFKQKYLNLLKLSILMPFF